VDTLLLLLLTYRQKKNPFVLSTPPPRPAPGQWGKRGNSSGSGATTATASAGATNGEGAKNQQQPPNISWLHKRKKASLSAASADGEEQPQERLPYVREAKQAVRPDFPPTDRLEMFHFTCLYYVPEDGSSNFFELWNPLRPETPLRLYRNAMVTLCEKLPRAVAEARKMENSNMPDDTQVEVAVINEYSNTRVILFVSVYKNVPHIFVRLYAMSAEKEVIPSTYGVKFSLADNIEKFSEFVITHK